MWESLAWPLAIITTLFYVAKSPLPALAPDATTYVLIAVCVIVGGGVGTVIALRIHMKSMPQLVAAFHSLVGLAAVLIAASAFYAPQSYGIGTVGDIRQASLIERALARPSARLPSRDRWWPSPSSRDW